MPRHNYDDDDDDLFLALQSMEPCGNCGTEGAKIPCMSGCGEVFYCSRECNMHHASAHRLRCRNLRCSKFNDSDSDSDSDDYEEFTDDSDEYETDDGEDDDEEEEDVKPKKGMKGKKGSMRKGKSVRGRGKRSDSANDGGTLAIDEDIERRIEEKILRRLKKQEENRIAMAIEQRMREEKANWRDEEMNRIIMEMRERFQNEMVNSTFLAALAKKNGVHLDPATVQAALKNENGPMTGGLAPSEPPSSDTTAVPSQAEEKKPSTTDGTPGALAVNASETRPRSTSKESAWNNACPAFEALRVVVWKHSFLPSMQFTKNAASGIWNSITQLDADESFSHIAEGDLLISVNGRTIDDSVQTEQDLNDVFAAFASPLILKFEARDPYSGKVHDYTVTWSNGPLGVTLKDDCSSQKVPIVNRLTKKAGSVAVKQNIAIGDILVAINNIDTIQLGCSLSMSILKKVQLPAKLRFRGVGGPLPGAEAPLSSTGAGVQPLDVQAVNANGTERRDGASSPSMSRPSSYIVTWGEGPLGLTIIPGFSDNDLPVIKKVTGTGMSPGIEKAQVGDLLETMNDIAAGSMPFEKVVAYLKSAPKPVILKFRSGTAEEASTKMPPATMPIKRSSSNDSMHTANRGLREMTVSRERTSQKSPDHRDLARQQSSGSDHSIPTERSEHYKVVWGGGPLGLTIDAIPNKTGAYIKRIAAQGAASALSQDCIGDDMTHINDFDVTRVLFQDIVNHLKNVPRPVTLYFRRRPAGAEPYRMTSSSSRSSSSSTTQPQRLTDPTVSSHRRPAAGPPDAPAVHYYNVVWQEGTPLGLSLRGADSSCDYPYITRVTGAGSAAHLPDSVVGDCLISVDGRSVHVRDKAFEEVMTMLKSMQKPLTLKFQARGQNHVPRAASSSNLHVPNLSAPPRANAMASDASSNTWRQQQQPPAPMAASSSSHFQSHSLPTPDDRLATSGLRQNSSLSRSFNTGNGSAPAADGTSGRALDQANEEKFSSIQAPFLVQNKLSTGRRQKMLKGLKK